MLWSPIGGTITGGREGVGREEGEGLRAGGSEGGFFMGQRVGKGKGQLG